MAPSPPPPADRAALRDRIAEALYRREWPNKQIWQQALAMDREVFEAMADAVLAVLPPPVSQADVIREVAGWFDSDGLHTTRMFGHQVAALLRRKADETQPAPCGECGHPESVHGEGDDPVSPGRCASCTDDFAWHNYQQDGAQP